MATIEYRFRWRRSTVIGYSWFAHRVVLDGEIDVAQGWAWTLRGAERNAASAINAHGRFVERIECGTTGGAVI